jgi:hypothetical protein
MIAATSRNDSPPGCGQPVPGATDGSRPSQSIDSRTSPPTGSCCISQERPCRWTSAAGTSRLPAARAAWTSAAFTLAAYLVPEVQVRVHSNHVEPVLLGQRPCQHRRDRVIAADDERDSSSSNDASECGPGSLSVVATVAEREGDVAAIDPGTAGRREAARLDRSRSCRARQRTLTRSPHSQRSVRKVPLLVVDLYATPCGIPSTAASVSCPPSASAGGNRGSAGVRSRSSLAYEASGRCWGRGEYLATDG